MSSGFLFDSQNFINDSLKPLFYDDRKYEKSEIFLPNKRPIETIFVSFNEIKDSLKPGDILEFKYPLFNHWAIFLGIYNCFYIVIHFRVVNPAPSMKHDIFIEPINTRNKVRINNINDHDVNRRLRSADEIRKLALERLEHHKKYNIITYNCKHFVKDLRYY